MQCRACGTEIADKAIVCYRCGTATTDPVRRPVPVGSSRRPLVSLVVAGAMMLLALYAGWASRSAADPEPWRTAAGVLAGAAAIVLVLALLRWRR